MTRKNFLEMALGAACMLALAFNCLGALPQAVLFTISEFATETANIDVRFAATTNRFAKQYVEDLDALRRKYQGEGMLDELLAVKNESERFTAALSGEADPFEEIAEMPEDCIVKSPAPLRNLQLKYVASLRDAFDASRSQSDAATAKLLKRIEAVQKELTRRGKIDSAIEVRSLAERLRKAIEEKRLAEELASIAPAPAPSAPAPAAPASSTAGASAGAPSQAREVPEAAPAPRPRPASMMPGANWKKWQYAGDRPFSPELKDLLSPGISSTVTAKFIDRGGTVFFSAAEGPREGQWVGGVFCEWSGQAAEWNVTSPDHLPAKLKITNDRLAQDSSRGPHLFVSVIGGDPAVQTLRVELLHQECEVKILRDSTNPNRFALFWPKAARTKPFTVEAGKPVRLVIGVALNGARQACSTTVQLLQP